MTSSSAGVLKTKRYGITRAVVGGARDFIEITEADFLELEGARSHVNAALSIEELLDCVVENYLELEADMLTISLRRGLTWEWTWDVVVSDMQRVNRRLGNLLASARQLIDATPQELEKVYGTGSSAATELKRAQAAAYDSMFGYRLMEALRNHTQHHGMPVGSVSFPHTREEEQGEVRWRCDVKANVLCERLREDEKFKKAIAAELESLEEVSLRPMVREYVSGLGSAFEKLREVMGDDTRRCKQKLRDATQRAKKEFSAGTTGLAAVGQDPESLRYTLNLPLNEEPLERHERLAGKNQMLHLVAMKYVASSE